MLANPPEERRSFWSRAHALVAPRWDIAYRLLAPRAKLIAAVALAIATVIWIRRAGDFHGYVLVGELALAGQDIYAGAHGLNTWPPFFSLLCVPLALLARPTPYLSRLVWVTLSLMLFWVALKLIVRLIHGRALRLQADGTALGLTSPEVLIPLLLCYRFVLQNFDNLQVNVLLFACTLAGLWAHVRGHDIAGGAAIGFAAAVKVMPIVFVPYFFYRRRYTVAVSASVVTVFLSLSPALAYGWPKFVEYVFSWRNALRAGWAVGQSNQSVFAMFDRYLGYGMTPATAFVKTSIRPSGEILPWMATLALVAAVALAAVLLFRGQESRGSRASLVEYSIVFIVSAIFGTVAWKHYFVVLLFPCFLLVALLRGNEFTRTERVIVLTGFGIYAALAGVPSTDLLGDWLATVTSMLSMTTIGVLVLLPLLFWLRTRVRTDTSSHSPAPPEAAR